MEPVCWTICIAAVLALFLLVGFSLTASLLILPILLALTVALATGLGLLLGVLNTFIRDVGQVAPICLQVLFWFTPIVYPISIVPDKLRDLMVVNPIYPLVSAYQDILVFQAWPPLTPLLSSLLASIALLSLGGLIYFKAADDMADVL